MGILYKCKTYMVGPMQYAEGRSWREEFTKSMNDIGVVTMDPYKKPFINTIKEDESTRDNFLDLMNKGELNIVHERMQEIRRFDLAMVDRSDFITGYINPDVPTYGTVEELVIGARMAKPTFIFVEGGKKRIPLWLLGVFKPTQFYDSIDEVTEKLYKIDSGEIEINQKNWRLLDVKYR